MVVSTKVQDNLDIKLPKDLIAKVPDYNHKMYTQVFNAYLTPNSHKFHKNKKSIAHLERDGLDSITSKIINPKRYKSVLKSKNKR